LVRHVRCKLRSANEIERTFEVYVRPRLGGKSIYNLRRSDIVELLDQIEDKNGPVMADRALAYVRKAFNWQATRDDSFTPPIVRGMARSKPSERKRTRFLDDQEIRDIWTALDELKNDAPLCYPRFVRTLLFCRAKARRGFENGLGRDRGRRLDHLERKIKKQARQRRSTNHGGSKFAWNQAEQRLRIFQ
jgi:hypothetical protein